jgi:predicted phage terminase large subunit-like protein
MKEGTASLEAFARLYFADACRLPFSPLHHCLFDRRRAKIATPLPERQGTLDVVVAPRGAAKSTFVSLIFPLHALLFGHDRYIVLVSATLRQAARRVANMRAALAKGGPLFEDFAPAGRAERRRWLRRASDHALELGEGRLEAFGAGAELRGVTHGPWRPTWIILDDVERGDRVRQARHRDALADWFAETIEPLGDAYTNIDVIGTLLHPDALPARLARRPDAEHRLFASILNEADDQGLWAEWSHVFHDLSEPDRQRRARAFFEARREAMLAGSRVLWPEKEDYYSLQVMRQTRGRAAFNKEKQNDPAEAEAGLFRRDRLRWFRLDGDRIELDRVDVLASAASSATSSGVSLGELRRFGFLDPALGRAEGDFAAIATVGLDAAGRLYALDVWLARATPSEQVARVFDLHAAWDYEAFGIEANHFQVLLMDPLEAERERRRAAGRPADLVLVERRHRAPKTDRISALEPLIEPGRLAFNEALGREFLAQLEAFPGGRHDDGPDALAAAVELARRAPETGIGAMRLGRLRRPPGSRQF